MTKKEQSEVEKIEKIIGNNTSINTQKRLKEKYPQRQHVIFDEEKIGKDLVWKCR